MDDNKRFFYINSRSRLSGTDENFTYQLILPHDNTYDTVCVVRALIPKSYYLIEQNENTFTLVEQGQNITVTIPVGNYTRRSLQAVIQTTLTNASTHSYQYLVKYPQSTDADTGKFTFTVVGNGTDKPSFAFTTYVYEALGFSQNSTNTFTSSAGIYSLTSTNVIKLQKEDALYIHSDIATNGTDDILTEIFINDPNYSTVTWECLNENLNSKKLKANTQNIYSFRLTNEDGQPIYLNGQNMILVLVLYKKDNTNEFLKSYFKYLLTKPSN